MKGRVVLHGAGYPSVYRARPMGRTQGTRGGAGTSTGLSVGEDRWPPDMHVHVKTIPPWLVWITVCGLAAGLFLLAFIACQARECARWSKSSAHALSVKLNVPLDEEK